MNLLKYIVFTLLLSVGIMLCVIFSCYSLEHPIRRYEMPAIYPFLLALIYYLSGKYKFKFRAKGLA